MDGMEVGLLSSPNFQVSTEMKPQTQVSGNVQRCCVLFQDLVRTDNITIITDSRRTGEIQDKSTDRALQEFVYKRLVAPVPHAPLLASTHKK